MCERRGLTAQHISQERINNIRSVFVFFFATKFLYKAMFHKVYNKITKIYLKKKNTTVKAADSDSKWPQYKTNNKVKIL